MLPHRPDVNNLRGEAELDQLADQQWVSACPSCGSVYRFRPELTDCANCGAVLDQGITPIDLSREPKFIGVMGFLKPVADSVMSSMRDENLLCDAGGPSLAERLDGPVACGWCGQQYKTRPESPNCAACGGVLPIPPGGDPGAPPPNAPRKLPVSFLFNLYGRQNVGGIVGLICILVGIPCVLIPFIGLPLILFGVIVTYSNFATACRRHAALTRGTHRPGRLESVTRIGPL